MISVVWCIQAMGVKKISDVICQDFLQLSFPHSNVWNQLRKRDGLASETARSKAAAARLAGVLVIFRGCRWKARECSRQADNVAGGAV